MAKLGLAVQGSTAGASGASDGRPEHQAMKLQHALRAPSSAQLRGSDREVLGPVAIAMVPLLEDDIDALRSLGTTTEAANDEA